MKLKDFAYAGIIAATSLAFVLGSVATGEAKSKKKVAAPPPPAPFALCYEPYKPVCGVRGGMKFNYANGCFARKDGAKVVAQNACPVTKAKVVKKAKKAKTAKKKMAKPMEASAKKPMKK